MEIKCEAALPIQIGAEVLWVRCGEPATASYRYGCVHEHVSERWTCDDHKPQPGMVGCRRCFEAGHECMMVGVPQ